MDPSEFGGGRVAGGDGADGGWKGGKRAASAVCAGLFTRLVFGLQEGDVCLGTVWGGRKGRETRSRKLSMDLCDEQGNVCVQMRGISSHR